MTKTVTTYTLELRDDADTHITTIEAEDLEHARSKAEEAAEAWAREGYWGDDGARVDVGWTLYADEDCEDEVADGSVTVNIEPNRSALIRNAIGPYLDGACGYDHDDHDWTSEGEGGCDENPGVWSTGGTSLMFSQHCRKCGLSCTETKTGSQYNPGEHDTVKYEMMSEEQIAKMRERGYMDPDEDDEDEDQPEPDYVKDFGNVRVELTRQDGGKWSAMASMIDRSSIRDGDTPRDAVLYALRGCFVHHANEDEVLAWAESIQDGDGDCEGIG